MLIAPSALRIADASSTAHLDKVERGYENMDHFNIEFKKEGKALRSIDFIQGEGTELMMAAGLLSRLRIEVILTFYCPFLFLKMTKMKMKRMRTQALRRKREPRLFREAALAQPFLSIPLNPSSLTPPLAPPRAPFRASCHLPAQKTPTSGAT